jgi:Helicase HerA, central domain/TraM recognition site of TraD and TraG
MGAPSPSALPTLTHMASLFGWSRTDSLLRLMTRRNGLVHVGTYRTQPSGTSTPAVICDAPELRRHVDRPWFRAEVARRLGSQLRPSSHGTRRTAALADAALARHTLICGATGSGKSRLLEHLILEQLARGYSLVLVDPKGETADRVLAQAVSRGIAPDLVTLLDPRRPAGIPGCNPLTSGIPLAQAVSDFVAVIRASATSWGPRLDDMLHNALLLVGSHGLSLYELARLLTRDDYREGLLNVSIRPADPATYREVCNYFRDEFGGWSRSERIQAVSPVLNKIRELLRSSFLRPLLCARRNTLALSRLWHRPGVVLLRLDRTALGEEGSRLLAGLITHLLFRTALRAAGPVPVVLAIDELPVLERFVGEALTEIITLARSQGIRCLVACQHLAQLSESLRAALLANAAVQAFLRLGYADAKLVAASLAVGAEPRILRLVANTDREDRKTERPETVEQRHPIRDAYGRPLRLSPTAWEKVRGNHLFGRDSVRDLQTLVATAGVTRLYVRAADTGAPVALKEYIAGLPATDYWIDGPALQLVVVFPRPRLTGVERWNESDATRAWTRCLLELPVQHAVLRVAAGEAGLIRVVDVPSPKVNRTRHEQFMEACSATAGQSCEEIQATLQWRQQQVERIATGHTDGEEEADDGSLA